MATEASTLSPRDKTVLSLLFDPEAQTDEEVVVDPQMLMDAQIGEDEVVRALIQEEQKGVALAEKQDLSGAMAIFDDLLLRHPDYASAFNNRAQIHRLQNHPDAAIRDLQRSSTLAKESMVGNRISAHHMQILRQSHGQMAAIYYTAGKEEQASQHFFLAGKYGSKVSKTMAVKTNPYAKMCGEMVKQSMSREMCNVTSDASM